jgi:cytoskeletal protein CcmA (bactofilin family)
MGSKNLQETTIAMGVKVEGEFTSEGDVIIEGEVNGSVKTESHLRVGEAAKIHANVSAKNAVVAGEIKGNVTVVEKLELGEHSIVEGDITTEVLSIAPGARVNGKLTMGGHTSV